MARFQGLSGASKLAVSVLVAACLGSIAQASTADSGPIQMPGTNHWYQYVSAPTPWPIARQQSDVLAYQGMPGHLVTVESADENIFISSLAQGQRFWLGAVDTGPSSSSQRTWRWADGPSTGTTFTECSAARSFYGVADQSCTDLAYANWAKGTDGWWQPSGAVFGEPSQAPSPTMAAIGNFLQFGLWDDMFIGSAAAQYSDGASYGYVVEFEPAAAVLAQTFTSSGNFVPVVDGLYRVDLLGAGGGGGNQYDGYVAGGGGGGGAFASGVVRLKAGQTLSLTVGSAGAGGIPYRWSDGAPGGDSVATLGGVPLIVAGGGAGGLGVSSSLGGAGGLPSFGVSDALSQTFGFAGGSGSAARLNWPLYHNGGEGGSAANSNGAGFDGTTTLCSWVSAAPEGRMPSGAGGRGYAGGYEGSVSNCVGVSGAVGVGNARGGQGACGTVGQNFGGGGGGGHDICPTSTMTGAPGLAIVTTLAVTPSVPTVKTVAAGDAAATVSWDPLAADGSSSPSFTVTAAPGGKTCTTTTTSCMIGGLTNRTLYTFTVTASNDVGTSPSSAPSSAVMPLAPGFQMWPTDLVVPIGASTALNLAQAAGGAAVSVTGAAKAAVIADSSGAASASYIASKSGLMKFTAAYSVKVGKKTTKYSTTSQLWVPSVVGPGNVKLGKSGAFKLSYCPPAAPIVVTLSDGRSMNLTADAAGKASSTLAFGTRGAVTYTVRVSGVQVFTGGLTVS